MKADVLRLTEIAKHGDNAVVSVNGAIGRRDGEYKCALHLHALHRQRYSGY